MVRRGYVKTQSRGQGVERENHWWSPLSLRQIQNLPPRNWKQQERTTGNRGEGFSGKLPDWKHLQWLSVLRNQLPHMWVKTEKSKAFLVSSEAARDRCQALSPAGSSQPRSGPTQNSLARPASLFQYTHTVGKARCHLWEERETFHTWWGSKKKRSTLGPQTHGWGWGESRKVAFSWLERGKDLIALGLFRM